MKAEKGGRRRPSPELLDKLPGLVGGPAGAAMAHVNTIVTARGREARAVALLALMGMLHGASNKQRLDITFYSEIYALLFVRGGRELLAQVARQLKERRARRS